MFKGRLLPITKNQALEAREMGPQLRAPGTLAEDPGFVLSPHTMAHSHLLLKIQGIWQHFLTLRTLGTYMMHIHHTRV